MPMLTRLRFTSIAIAALALVALGAGAARATVITTGCADPSFCFVRELFDGGTIQVDDKLFDSWAPVAGADFINSTRVSGLDDDPLNPGLLYISGFNAQAPDERIATFVFSVSVLDPTRAITDNSLQLLSFDRIGEGSSITILEAVAEAGGGSLLSLEDVFSNDSEQDLSDQEEFAAQSEIDVGTKIVLHPGLQKGSFVKLNRFEQRFSQTVRDASVPEPSAALLFAGGALLVFRAVRGRRAAA
jgi:hypothetical protein